jgi:hypothetical protein
MRPNDVCADRHDAGAEPRPAKAGDRATPQAARGLWGHQMNRIDRSAIMCMLLIAAFTLLHQKHNAA